MNEVTDDDKCFVDLYSDLKRNNVVKVTKMEFEKSLKKLIDMKLINCIEVKYFVKDGKRQARGVIVKDYSDVLFKDYYYSLSSLGREEIDKEEYIKWYPVY